MKICRTCKLSELDVMCELVCTCEKSEEYEEFVEDDDTCDKWEGEEE